MCTYSHSSHLDKVQKVWRNPVNSFEKCTQTGTPSWTVVVDNFQKSIWSRAIIHQDQVVFIQLNIQSPTPIGSIHITSLTHPNHNLKVYSHSMVLYSWFLWRKSFWCLRWNGLPTQNWTSHFWQIVCFEQRMVIWSYWYTHIFHLL